MNKLQKFFGILLIAIVLCIPAFENGFPFTFPDSIGYITLGFKNTLGNARVWLYSGFVRHISLWETLWLIPLAQGVIVAMTINLMFKYFFKERYRDLSFIIYTLFIAITTGVSFHTCMIMPDIFTPIVILTFCLLLFAKGMTKIDYGITLIFFLFASGVHNSHIILSIGLIGLLLLAKCTKYWRVKLTNLGGTNRKIILLPIYVICAYLFVCTVHYSKGGNFAATRGGSIFLFARLCDFGIPQQYLKENCGKTVEDAICDHYLGIGRHFLWGGGSYFNKTGAWKKENEEFYKELVWDILTTPKYFKKYIVCSIEGTFQQFFYYSYDPHIDMKNSRDNHVIKAIQYYFPSNYFAANNCKQVNGLYADFDIRMNNTIQRFVFYLSGLLLILLFFDPNYSEKHKAIALLILLGILMNAFIVASTSGVYDRYQCRVAWLITLPAFWYLYDRIQNYNFTHKISQNKTEQEKDIIQD